MSVKVRIPSPLRSYTNGVDVIEAEGGSVGDVLNGLKDKAAGIETRLFKGPNQLNRFVNVYLNDEDIRFLKNLETPVKAGDEIRIKHRTPQLITNLQAARDDADGFC
jgi:molybdopterin synthase sulfur carrier subunit